MYIHICVCVFNFLYLPINIPDSPQYNRCMTYAARAMATGRLFGPSRCLGVPDTDASDASHKSWRPGEVTLHMANNG